MRTSHALKTIKPYMFVAINAKRDELMAQGKDVISLGAGDPDRSTPQHIVDALVDAVRDPRNHHYPNYRGLPEFRQAAATYMRRRFGLELDPEREILGLIGSKEGLTHLAMAFLDPGDYVLAPSIGYVSYTVGAEMMGARVHYLPMNEGNGFLADFDHVPETVLQRAKILFLNYPNNPTGAIAPVEYLDRAIAFCREHDILLAYDNAYVDITFDGYVAPSILERPGAMDHAVEFLSLSKGYNMTGWRLAFAAGNAAALQALLKVKSNTDSGQFNAVQRAGIVALTGPQDCVEESCSIYQRRRDLVVEALNGMGLWCEPTKGSIYVWAKVPEAYTSSSFTTKMLDEALVVLAPGSGYGPDGEGYVRISLTTPEERIAEAMRRMKEVL